MTLFCSITSPHEWVILDRSGKLLEQGTVDSLAEVPRHDPLALIVPGEYITIHQLTLPTHSRARMLQAIPNILEEQLATDIDQLHFALLHWQRGGQAIVAVVARDLMKCWLADCQQVGLLPLQMLPDYLCLPRHPQSTVTLAKLGADSVLLRDGEFSGLAMDLDNLSYWLAEQTEQSPVLAVNDEELAIQLTEAGTREVNRWPFGQGMQEWITKSDIPPCNLLQGLFAPQQSQAPAAARWLKIAGSVVLISVFMRVAADGYEYNQLNRKQQRLTAEVATLLKSNFPEIKKIVKPKIQLQRELEKLGTNRSLNNFVFLLNAVSKKKKKQAFRINELDYRKNSIKLTISIKSFTTLEHLQALLQADHRITSKLLSSDSKNKEVNAILLLSVSGT